jgi:AcrR family transcriptional regulator
MEAVTGAPTKIEPPQETETADGGAKRRQVLDGARAVFLNDGFDGASMNDIARVAGVSKGTLYVYFESKEALFEALIREDRKQQAERFVPNGEWRTAREYLALYGRRLASALMRPDLIAQSRMVISASAKFPRFGEAFYEAGPCHGIRRLTAQFEEFVRSGELEIDNIELAAQQFSELCKAGVFHRAMFCGADSVTKEEIDRTVTGAVEVFMRAYGKTG